MSHSLLVGRLRQKSNSALRHELEEGCTQVSTDKDQDWAAQLLARIDPDGWVKERSVVKGDTIRFRESVFSGRRFRRRFCIGNRVIIGRVLRESYGALTAQHTFSIEVIACEGKEPIAPGAIVLRKGRNMYRRLKRQRWHNEDVRRAAVAEKNERAERAYESAKVARREQWRRKKEKRRAARAAERERQEAARVEREQRRQAA
jgi:hypothetical protein